MDLEKNIVYNGDFSLPEVAAEWTVRQDLSLGRWEYFNRGGREEDIFFIFIPKSLARTSGTCMTDEAGASLVSPPIELKAGVSYEISYEIRLFGKKVAAQTMLTLRKENGEGEAVASVTLEQKEWPLDEFQWPVGVIGFSVEESCRCRIIFSICNAVPMRLYWLTVASFTHRCIAFRDGR